jgi:hypothetical protein
MFFKKRQYLPLKTQLCSYSPLISPLNLKDNKYNLISNLPEIKTIQKAYKNDFLKIFYFNMKNVNNILFELEESIKIDADDENDNYKNYFYLCSLIVDNPYIINYEYSIDYIYNIIKYQKTIDNNLSLKNIIISKIIITLIDNYCESDLYDEEKEEKELQQIKEDNLNIIKKNIYYFKLMKIKLNKFDIKLKNINELYMIIITFLIKNNKLIDYENSCKIFKELNCESIDFNYQFLKEIFKILIPEAFYIKDNIINHIEDLFDIKKVNFYYVLLKYIIKYSIYIYWTPILIKTNKLMKEMINSMTINMSVVESYEKNSYKDRIEFIIKKICDSEYFYTLFLNKLNLTKLDEILKYYKDNLSDIKKDDIIIIEKVMKKKKYNQSCDIYLKDFETAVKTNKENFEKIKYNYMKSKDDMNMKFRLMRMKGRGMPFFGFNPRHDFLLDYRMKYDDFDDCDDFDFHFCDHEDFISRKMHKHLHHNIFFKHNNRAKPDK